MSQTVIVYFRKENITLSDRARSLLYHITNAAVHLTETEINNALDEVDCSPEERNQFAIAINNYRNNGSNLVLKKRHSVLLILDEVQYYTLNLYCKKSSNNCLIISQQLECLPWETIPCLKRHPVSRVSSIHIVHRLYIKHKDSIENGLM